MKILMLGWELPPFNSGGLGVACYQMCKALSEKDIDIEFLIPYSAEHNIEFMNVKAALPQSADTIIKSGIAYDSFKYIKTDGSVEWLDIYDQQSLYDNAVVKLVDYCEFDIIHAHDWLTFRAGIRVKEKTGKPLILHVHSLESDRAGGNYGNPLAREVEYQSMMLADRVIAVSNHTKKTIIRDYSIPADKIEVIHNSIDIQPDFQLDERNAYRYAETLKTQGYNIIVNIGRLTIQKGLTNLLRAFRMVLDYQPRALLLFVGSGEQETELLSLAAELGISQNVIFAGFQRGKNWRDAFMISDLFVMTSVSEPFGLTPLEAIGYGSPVLVSKQSGVSEVIKNALKVDYWDVKEIANQICSVIGSGGLRNELYNNAAKEYASLSWAKAADELVQLYSRHLEAVAG